MPDPFKNARAYYDVNFPSSGDSFLQVVSGIKNALQGLGFMDMIPLQPRAHNPPDNKIMVRGRDASAFFNPIYSIDANSRILFSSGDSPAFSAPSSNPRIDIVYITPSGDIRIQQGTEASVPTLPSLAPSGDTRMPICAIFNRPGQARIVNFENKDASTGDGYIYQDLRPFITQPKAGANLSLLTPISPTGDSFAGPGTSIVAAREDHVHGGIHAMRIIGTGDGLGNAFSNLQGDIQLAGGVSVGGNRFTVVNVPMGSFRNLAVTRPTIARVLVTFDEMVFQDKDMRSAWESNKSVLIDITVSGAGGLDSGTEQANKIYYVFLIRNSLTGVVNGILSADPKYPLIPSGFNQIALVSAVGNDNSSNFINFNQTGRKYCFAVWATLATTNGSISPWLSVSLVPANMSTIAGFVPRALSNFCFGSMAIGTGSKTVQMTNDSTVSTSAGSVTPNKFGCGGVQSESFWQFDVITQDTLYYSGDSSDGVIYLAGFEINKLI